MEKYNIINKSQYGFRSGISIADELADVTECINDNLEKFKKCAVVSIDLNI